MKTILYIGGILTVGLGVVLLMTALDNYRVIQSGQKVKVILIGLPECKGYKNNFIKFRYKGIEYVQRVKCKYIRQYKKGDEAEMLHRESTNIFLFKEENILLDVFYTGCLVVVGVFSLALAYRRRT